MSKGESGMLPLLVFFSVIGWRGIMWDNSSGLMSFEVTWLARAGNQEELLRDESPKGFSSVFAGSIHLSYTHVYSGHLDISSGYISPPMGELRPHATHTHLRTLLRRPIPLRRIRGSPRREGCPCSGARGGQGKDRRARGRFRVKGGTRLGFLFIVVLGCKINAHTVKKLRRLCFHYSRIRSRRVLLE